MKFGAVNCSRLGSAKADRYWVDFGYKILQGSTLVKGR